MKKIRSKAQPPIGEKKKRDVVYSFPCNCRTISYTGETKKKFDVRGHKHQNNLRNGRTEEAAEKRMNADGGGLPRHSSQGENYIDWESPRIFHIEPRTDQRKVTESIETERVRYAGKVHLSKLKPIEPWKPLTYNYFDVEKERGADLESR